MDETKTAAFELGEGADACLLLHGFTGSPWDLRPLGERLAARGFFVSAPRLPGHGTTPEALLHVGHLEWEAAAREALEGLAPYHRVFVAGLSMGALLALLLAARFPERVHGLALVAPAIRFVGPRMALLRALRRTPLLPLVRPWVAKTGTDLSDPDQLAQAPILPAFPTVRLDDLWALQEKAVAALPHVLCPTLVAVARQDHVVDPEGGRLIARGLTASPVVRFIELQEGFHIIPRDRAGGLLADEVAALFERARG